ncbi:hypothetical protein [Galbibacter mesophilus]|uniref:hypothetical protein n=1 Tax=Galbibacter mesophilus TaxID=379069 RepID=UPI00191F0DDD|nr:hypothetical protein [Galbibacter mesophilus]MCM5664456.1 hypothetical protein [Galbibacter mesophilus]
MPNYGRKGNSGLIKIEMASRDNLETRQGCLILLSPFILVLAGMLVFVGIDKQLDIVLNNEYYKKGFLIVDSIQNYSGGRVRVMNYNGYGRIENTKIRGKIYIGTGNKTNFNRKKYPVFYREDGEFTLRRQESETEFNVIPYVFKFIGFTVVPILVLMLLAIYYFKLRKRLKDENMHLGML